MKTEWINIGAVCNSFGLEYLSLESKKESDHMSKLFSELSDKIDRDVYVSAITKTSSSGTKDWYWSSSGKNVSFEIDFAPGEPNNWNGEEYCLSFIVENSKTLYNDMKCSDHASQFVCQRLVESSSSPVTSAKVDESDSDDQTLTTESPVEETTTEKNDNNESDDSIKSSPKDEESATLATESPVEETTKRNVEMDYHDSTDSTKSSPTIMTEKNQENNSDDPTTTRSHRFEESENDSDDETLTTEAPDAPEEEETTEEIANNGFDSDED